MSRRHGPVARPTEEDLSAFTENLGRTMYLEDHPCQNGFTSECKSWYDENKESLETYHYKWIDNYPCPFSQRPWIPWSTYPGFLTEQEAGDLYGKCRDKTFGAIAKAASQQTDKSPEDAWNYALKHNLKGNFDVTCPKTSSMACAQKFFTEGDTYFDVPINEVADDDPQFADTAWMTMRQVWEFFIPY